MGGGGGGFFARLGGGGGAFLPFVVLLLSSLPCDVAGLTDLAPYDLSGLPLLNVESSEGSLKTSPFVMLARLGAGRS